jgi:hypothetical protein
MTNTSENITLATSPVCSGLSYLIPAKKAEKLTSIEKNRVKAKVPNIWQQSTHARIFQKKMMS